MLNRFLPCGLMLTFVIACDDDGSANNDAGTETARAETAGTDAQSTGYASFVARGIELDLLKPSHFS